MTKDGIPYRVSRKKADPEVPKGAVVEEVEGEPKVVIVAVMTHLARHPAVQPRYVVEVPFDDETKGLLQVGDYRFLTKEELAEYSKYRRRGEREDFLVPHQQYSKPMGSPGPSARDRAEMEQLFREAAG